MSGIGGLIKGLASKGSKVATFLPKTGIALGGKGEMILNKVLALVMSLSLGLPNKLASLAIMLPEKLIKYVIVGIENLTNLAVFPVKEIGGKVL